jgi:hypothetical protein
MKIIAHCAKIRQIWSPWFKRQTPGSLQSQTRHSSTLISMAPPKNFSGRKFFPKIGSIARNETELPETKAAKNNIKNCKRHSGHRV